MRHHLHLVEGHDALGVVAVVGRPARLAAVPVAPEVGGHHGEMPRQGAGRLVPDGVGLGVAVQQQQRRAGTAPHELDRLPVGLETKPFEALEHASPSCQVS